MLKRSIESQPGFYWVHLMDPHFPYYPQKVTDRNIEVQFSPKEIKYINDKIRGPSARSMGLDKRGKDLPPPSETEIEFCREIYGEIVKYVDRKIAELFEFLIHNSNWENTMIIILADHGEAFGESGVFQHDWTADPVDPLVKVPLAVKYPKNKFAGETFSHSVQTGDLLATLSEIYKLECKYPPYTRPFTKSGYRPIISKSNNAIRVTTDDGYAIQRGDSIVKRSGDIGEDALAVLRDSTLPTVQSMSGKIPGMTDREQNELEDRLKHLGYR